MTNQKKLEQLKAEQEALQQKIAIQEQMAKNEKKINEAKIYAEETLAKKVRGLQNKYEETVKYFNALYKVDNKVEIKHGKKTVEVTPSCYIMQEDGDRKEQVFEPFSDEVDTAKITYKGYEIRIVLHVPMSGSYYHRSGGKWKMQWQNSYDAKYYTNAKTVITRINEAIEVGKAQRERRDSQSQAMDLALAWICKNYPQAEVMKDKEWIGSRWGGKTGGYEIHLIKVKFGNGNSVTYSVSYMAEKPFTLSYRSHTIAAINEKKKDPKKLLDFLAK